MTAALAIAAAFLMSILRNAARFVWDDLWNFLFEQVARAEEAFGRGAGTEKAKLVKDEVLKWIDGHAKLNWLQRIIASYMIQRVISAVVKALNDELGQDWVSAAADAKRDMEETIPVLSFLLNGGVPA